MVGDCGLHKDWRPYFETQITKAEEKDKLESETTIKEVNSQIQTTETKLNRLLDGYLDQVIEPQIYKQKKNELFEEKWRLVEKKSQIEKDGNCWLEPMRKFLNCALQAQKIARKKNNSHDLSIMAKKVGSNFLLKDCHLSATFDFPFRALSAEAGAVSAPPNSNSISLMVTPAGFEPAIFRMRT